MRRQLHTNIIMLFAYYMAKVEVYLAKNTIGLLVYNFIRADQFTTISQDDKTTPRLIFIYLWMPMCYSHESKQICYSLRPSLLYMVLGYSTAQYMINVQYTTVIQLHCNNKWPQLRESTKMR